MYKNKKNTCKVREDMLKYSLEMRKPIKKQSRYIEKKQKEKMVEAESHLQKYIEISLFRSFSEMGEIKQSKKKRSNR